MSISKFIQSCIHLWLNHTGRKLDLSHYPYLAGPIAGNEEIGEKFYSKLAERNGLKAVHSGNGGLLLNFRELIVQDHPFINRLNPEIPLFYEHSSRYTMEVWSQWRPPISWLAKLLIKLVSVEMKQLNIPLDSLETSYGMDSAIIHLLDDNGEIEYVCWLRKTNKSNKVVYAGFYSSIQLGNWPARHVKVVFPLPNGNVTVILRLKLLADGSIQLISDGKRFGHSGYYRLHRNRRGVVKARMIPIKEIIHVFEDQQQQLRTDHFFSWWGIRFLQLHYKITPKATSRG